MDHVYVVMTLDADSWHSVPHFYSVHRTVEGAINSLPPFAFQYERKATAPHVVKDFAYFRILEVALGA